MPKLAWLGYRSNQRIYQHRTVPQIIGLVLEEHGILGGAYRFQLGPTVYPERDYCVERHQRPGAEPVAAWRQCLAQAPADRSRDLIAQGPARGAFFMAGGRQLHPQFSAQQQYDRTWAQRTMALLFLRHKQVRVLAIGTRSEVDPTYSDKGHTRAELAMTGAEGLIPDSARHYSVRLEWWLEDGEWRLARLSWE